MGVESNWGAFAVTQRRGDGDLEVLRYGKSVIYFQGRTDHTCPCLMCNVKKRRFSDGAYRFELST